LPPFHFCSADEDKEDAMGIWSGWMECGIMELIIHELLSIFNLGQPLLLGI
jgi:hypothetical protein